MLRQMFSLSKPTDIQIKSFITEQSQKPFSYPKVGATSTNLPTGYKIDHNRRYLGQGPETFEQAKAAIRAWEMFNLKWVQLCWPNSPIEAGVTVAILAQISYIWSLNVARIVYSIDTDGPAERFGFAYGTLPGHVERGEERFMVEWQRKDNTVWYDLLAFSRPNHVLSKLGYPFARKQQRRFAIGSMQAMERAIGR